MRYACKRRLRQALYHWARTSLQYDAAALAYYGYSYTADLSSRERALVEDTMHELAVEKVIGIESQIIEHSEAVPWAPGEFVVRFGARISTPG